MSTYDNNAMVSGRGIVSDLPFLQQGVSLRGRYVIESVLGSGGFGVTYKAWDALLSSNVAIKEYFPKSVVNRMPGDASVSVFTSVNADEFNRGIHRFLKEAKDLARFNEIPGIVSVFDFFEENNTAYMVMEYLEGCTLREYLRSNGERIDINTGLYMIDRLITALEAVHRSGIIHRDISPENIFICNDSSVKLLDFGAAKQTMDTYTQTVSIVLKHGYAPPEQYLSRGDFGPWTDIYALGATMYRMFTGVMPQESVERMVDDKLPAPDVINPEIPKYLSDAIMTSMEVKAERRYQSVDVLRRDLMGHENIDNASMLRKIVMICAPIIGVAVVVICIVLAVQLNKSEPKRRNITEEVSAVASDTTTEEFTENIADNTSEMKSENSTDDKSKPAIRKAGNVNQFDNTEQDSENDLSDTEADMEYDYTEDNGDGDIGEQSSSLGVKISAITVSDSETDMTTDKRVYEKGVKNIFFYWKVISAPPEGTRIKYTGTYWTGEPYEDMFYGVQSGDMLSVCISCSGNGMGAGTVTIELYDYMSDELLGEASVEIK